MKTMKLACAIVMAMAGSALAQPGTGAPPPPTGGGGSPGVCIVIDPTRDTLPEPERNAARSVLEVAFETEKLAVDRSGTACTETYQVSNIKLGATINVTITGPRGTRTGRATGIDDLGNVYSQMVKSLVTGAQMVTGGGTTDRTNVTKEQSAPRRVAADNLKYAQLGYGGITTRGNFGLGPYFAGGYRHELDKVALDVAMTFLLANDAADNDGVVFNLIRLMVLVNQDPLKDSTIYYGGGVSYGWSWVGKGVSDEYYSGGGLQGNASVGYAAFRSSTIRAFLQLDLTLPMYKVRGNSLFGSESSTDTGWSPSAMFSLGFGWGKTTQVVRVINE